MRRLSQARAAELTRQAGLSEKDRSTEEVERVKGTAAIPPLTEPNETTPIILEVSSFLDGERCGRTLGLAFGRAAQPQRIHASVLQARRRSDTDCLNSFKVGHLPKLCKDLKLLGKLGLPQDEQSAEGCKRELLRHVRAWVIPPEHGMGPVHQRGVAQGLLQFDREDAMCISTDSHMGFLKEWDTLLLQEWAAVRNEFAVLTVYPPTMGLQDMRVEDAKTYSTFCGYEHEVSGMERNMPRGRAPAAAPRHAGELPRLTMNWAAGFSFHRCHAERAVPADVHLKWMFTGEEADRAVRLWTHGYDMYIPTRPIVLHDYTNAKQAFWAYRKVDSNKPSLDRLRTVLHFEEPGNPPVKVEENYSLGDQRKIEAFVEWSRQDLGGHWERWLKEKELPEKNGFSWCKELERQPVRDEEALVASIGVLQPARGHIRLSEYPKGRLELYDGNRWGVICKWPWASDDAAEILCQKLGYLKGKPFTFGAGGFELPVVAGSRACTSEMEDILECPVATPSEFEGCTIADTQGLACEGPQEVFESPDNGGCCQVSRQNTKCATFEYSKGCCVVGEPDCFRPMCKRGFWAKGSQWDPASGNCKPLDHPKQEQVKLPTRHQYLQTDPEVVPIPVH